MMKPSVFLLNLLVAQSIGAVDVFDKDGKIVYKGTTANGVESFLGIPFGDDVDGMKRFTRPVLRKLPAGTVVDATKPGPACPQQKVPVSIFPLFSHVTNVSENCLNLRVDRPANTTANAKLPVMAWIYGGGNSIGQAYDKLYTPNGLILGAVAKKTPIIYVSMNYRLNIFGFASSKALEKEGNTNAGLLDQRLALEWIQKNIAHFGGDPQRVTIFGESDGATGVGLQITAYGGKGAAPFQQAIMQSGAPTADTNVDSNYSAKNTLKVAKVLGCDTESPEDVIQCLRKAPYKQLFKATRKIEKEINQFGFDAFVATVDSNFIPEAPSKLLREGRFYKGINSIVGWTLDDSSLFTPPDLANEKAVKKYFVESQPYFTKKSIKKLLSLYPVSDFQAAFNSSRAYYQTSRIQRDIETVCPSLFFAMLNTKYSEAKTYLYQLDQTPLTSLLKQIHQEQYGVPHFSDIFYVFNELLGYPDPLKPSDYTLAGQVSGSWAYFASAGKPGSDEGQAKNATLGTWPMAFEKSGKAKTRSSVYVIGGKGGGPVELKKSTTSPGLDRLLSRCAFVSTKSFYKQLRT